MTRDEIVDATYEASSRLNWVKLLQYGLMEAARPVWGGSAGFLDVRASVDATAPGEGDPGEDRERAADL